MQSLAVVITRDAHQSIGSRLDNHKVVAGAVPLQIPGTVSESPDYFNTSCDVCYDNKLHNTGDTDSMWLY